MIALRILSLVVALVLTAPAVLFAQQEPPVAPGDRVRVTAPTEFSGRLVGTVMEIGADTCVLEAKRAEPLALPLASVTMLEVSDQKSWPITGAAVGALLGGIIWATAEYAGCIYRCSPEKAKEDALLGGAKGVAVGAGIGALIGSAIKTDRWEEVPLDRLRVTIVPQRRGGFVVSASIRL